MPTNQFNAYNDVPYESFPFKQSHPAHLFTMGTLFGLKPKPIEEARILELGCAAGGNIIPIALVYPDTEIVGIDSSEVEIKMGQEMIADLSLNNISLRNQSILDFEKEEGTFDYIICHGVYSWVPDEVRESILKICNQNLSQNGIAYVSYNTLPGWNMMNNIRDLMLWHTKNIEDSMSKVRQARSILKFITDGLEQENSAYSQFLRQEIKVIENQTDNYILHEHLSPNNKPFYFNEFLGDATKHELAYLGDSILSTMYTDNLPPKFSNELKKISNLAAVNQYMDFIRNNRFRCTLLCHNNQKIDRSLKSESISRYFLKLIGKLDKPEFTEDLVFNDEPIMLQRGGIKLSAKKTQIKAVLYVLYQHRTQHISYHTLQSELKKLLNKDEKEVDIILTSEANLLRMALGGLIDIACYANSHVTEISEKPMVCPLVRYQAKLKSSVTNRYHQVVKLENIERYITQFVDGTLTVAEIEQRMVKGINEGELNIMDAEKKPLTNPQQKELAVKEFVSQALKRFCHTALMIE